MNRGTSPLGLSRDEWIMGVLVALLVLLTLLAGKARGEVVTTPAVAPTEARVLVLPKHRLRVPCYCTCICCGCDGVPGFIEVRQVGWMEV